MYKTERYCTPDNLVPVKSKFEADIIRFSIQSVDTISYDGFKKLLAKRHNFGPDLNFLIWYMDPVDSNLLPINNEFTLRKALYTTRNLLRIFLERKGEKSEHSKMYGLPKRKEKYSILSRLYKTKIISKPTDFRQLSGIIDVDVLPKTCRRVRLMKHKSDKPLGFYVKEGRSFRVLPVSAGGGVEEVRGVFISRVVPGGLAESTGLLSVNDEVLEVNGIDVLGKTLDQVTDMIIANMCNLIITVKPAAKPLNNNYICNRCNSPSISETPSQRISVGDQKDSLMESWV